MYGKILQKLLQRFFQTMGRAPVSAAEWSKLRRQAMEFARKKGGDPITGKPFPGWNPKVIEGGKSKKGIESLMKLGDVQLGKAPKTSKLTLDRKKEGLEGQINKEKWIARKKQENKDAIRRFKEKNPRTVEDFRDKGDWDPYGMAQGGIAPLIGEPSYAANFYDDRTPMEEGGPSVDEFRKDKMYNEMMKWMHEYEQYKKNYEWEKKKRSGIEEAAQGGRIGLAGGGALFKFIEKLFIKASNDIRLGRGKWKGLDQKQKIVQHDNLTKKVTEFQKSGNTEGLEVYFGVNPNEAFAAAQAKVKSPLQKEVSERTGKVFNPKTDLYEGIDERTALKQKYPGVTDDLIEKILIDDNPQRKAEVLATMDEYLKLREVGKGEEEAFNIVVDSFQKPTKHAEGGRIGFNPGGPVDHDALVQMYLAEGLSYDEAVQAAQSTTNLPWDTLKKAEGGIMRERHIFGGSAGLKGMWKSILKHLSKGRDKPITKLFPKLSVRDKEMEKLVMGTPEQKAFREGEAAHKLEGIDMLINRLKHDKKLLAQIESNKAMKDEGLDFLMKHLIEKSGMYPKHLKKYTDIDKDILQMENIKKNLIMKDRKLNAEGGQIDDDAEGETPPLSEIAANMFGYAEGGRIGYAGGGQAGLPAVTMGMPLPAMQQPQMPAGPQPAGIPGGTIVAQNQMQQAPWMGSQMQQGMGGMPRPQPQGQPRMPFGLGGMSRRAFMKLMGLGAALPFIPKAASKLLPKAAPKIAETVATAGSGTGMPAWFPAFVQKALKHGEDVSSANAPAERIIVSKTKLPNSKTDVYVEHDIVTGDTTVDIGMGKHGWSDGYHGQPTRLILKKGEIIEEGKMKGQKTPDEFTVEEAEFTGGHPENVKFEETSYNNYGEHGSDFSELEEFATGKVTKESKAQKQVWEADWDDSLPDYEDYASGGLARMLGE